MDITINNTSVHYVVHGEGFPILFLHGYTLDHEVMVGAFEPIFQERTGYQRIYVDMPGMGRTPATEATKTTKDIVALLNGFIEAIIPEQRFMLCGFSYGGYVARGILKAKQALIDGMMLMAPVIDPAHRDAPETTIIVSDPEAVKLLPPEFAPIVLTTMAVQSKAIFQRIADEYTDSLHRADHAFLAELSKAENYCFTSDVDALDTPFDKPTLILTGKQDSRVGFADAFTLSRAYPRATYVALDRGGHGMYLEQDAIFKLLVNEWLDRVTEALKNPTTLKTPV